MDIFDQQSFRDHSAGVNQLNAETMSLQDLMGLAALFHLGRANSSEKNLADVIHVIQQRAMEELEIGDGFKYETVRVERKLDGTVAIFFGF